MADLPDDVAAHRAWLLAFIQPPADGTIVDLGCGRGEDLRALAAHHPDPDLRLIGIDASESGLAVAHEASAGDVRLRFEQHHLAGTLPFDDGSVDAVYSNNLLECLADADGFAAEVARILRPGGQVVIGHWDWDSQLFDGSDKARIRRLVHACADWQQAWMEHADGWMGRRLRGVFNVTGQFDGQIHARVLTNTAFEPPWFGHANAQALRSLVKRGLASAEDVDGFLSEQANLHCEGRYFYSITGYAFVGRRA